MGVRLAALLAVVGGALAFLAMDAAAAVTKLCQNFGEPCALVTVPLDRTGAVPGTVRLRVEQMTADDPSRPPLLMLGGPPGWSAIENFGGEMLAEMLGNERSSRDLIFMDLRGTGRSGLLRCPALERSRYPGTATAAARCASSLGARRGFYTAQDSAEDIEAVRQALGIDRIAIYGASYGSQVAVVYARRHPGRVDRLLLDSPYPAGGFDSLYRSSFESVPRAIHSFCRRGSCRRATPTPVADVARLARRIERHPMRGIVVDSVGRRRVARIGAFGLLNVLRRGSELSFWGRDSALPGLLRNAVRGDLAPLLRIKRLARTFGITRAIPTRIFSRAAYAASRCEESQLPWPRGGGFELRPAQAVTFVNALPSSAFEPFGPRAALQSDVLALCRHWPTAPQAPKSLEPLSPVTTLIVASDLDINAPLSDARALGRLIPGSRVLSVSDQGAWAGWSGGRCAARAVRQFLAGGVISDACDTRQRPEFAIPGPPMTLSDVDSDPGTSGRPGRTLAAVRLTLLDGIASLGFRVVQRAIETRDFRLGKIGLVKAAGLRRGSYSFVDSGRLAAHGASYVPGVRVSGWIANLGRTGDLEPRGVIRVAGPAAARGTLTVAGGVTRGTLGGHKVSTRLRLGRESILFSFGASAPSSRLARLTRVLPDPR